MALLFLINAHPTCRYSTCKNLLKDVFEELMMPLPACLSPYSGSSTPVQSRNESESEEGEGEGEGPSCPRSLELSFTEEPIQRTKYWLKTGFNTRQTGFSI